MPQTVVEQIVDLTQNSTPEGETHWNTRTMAKRVGRTRRSPSSYSKLRHTTSSGSGTVLRDTA